MCVYIYIYIYIYIYLYLYNIHRTKRTVRPRLERGAKGARYIYIYIHIYTCTYPAHPPIRVNPNSAGGGGEVYIYCKHILDILYVCVYMYIIHCP